MATLEEIGALFEKTLDERLGKTLDERLGLQGQNVNLMQMQKDIAKMKKDIAQMQKDTAQMQKDTASLVAVNPDAALLKLDPALDGQGGEQYTLRHEKGLLQLGHTCDIKTTRWPSAQLIVCCLGEFVLRSFRRPWKVVAFVKKSSLKFHAN